MNLFNHFFPTNIKTCISDATYDFTLPADGFSLTDAQQQFIDQAFKGHQKFIFSPRQVHGDEVIVVNEKLARHPKLLMADAVITNIKKLPIAVRVADCLPLLLHDPVNQVIGAVHAGWKSTEQKIASKTIQKMIDVYGTDPKDINAAIGPCIRPAVYDVGEEFLTYFSRNIIERDGKRYFDNPQENKDQLNEIGVLPEHIFDCELCSYSDQQLHSFRRDGDHSGRMLCAIMMM